MVLEHWWQRSTKKEKWCSGHHSVIDWMTSGYSKRNSPSWLGWVREIVGLSRSNRSRLHHRTSHLGKYARNHKMSRNVDRYFCVSFFSHIPDSLAIFLGDQNKHCKERALITSTQSQTNTPCRIGGSKLIRPAMQNKSNIICKKWIISHDIKCNIVESHNIIPIW